jgi:hypothetical protein
MLDYIFMQELVGGFGNYFYLTFISIQRPSVPIFKIGILCLNLQVSNHIDSP